MTRRNIRLLIAFDGTSYSGWQRQNQVPTIQGTIEECLSVMTRSPVTLCGAGRTDAGVHALGMTAHFLTSSSIPAGSFFRGLNSMLPDDIRIISADEAAEEFHSRFSATGKSYRYDIFTGEVQLPTERRYTAYFPGRHHIDNIRICLMQLTGTHDFSSFEGCGSRDRSLTSGRGAVRTIYSARLISHPGKQETWSFYFTGDGFLRHMIRNIVGTLMDVGREKISPEQFFNIMQSCDRKLAGATAPAQGLFLEKVFYEPLVRLTR